jgi:crotonobetainyl-CoA:carnitine CoA-transferase CaiB-like acyl-CoA transferase
MPSARSADMTAAALWRALGATSGTAALHLTGHGSMPSVFPVTDLATASIGVAALAAASLLAPEDPPPVTVDRGLASHWFAWSLRPDGWSPPAPWDPIAGDYATSDGWIRLHTNAPHHRAAALGVLGIAETDPTDRVHVTDAVARMRADELEAAVVDAGGCAATMHDLDTWRAHPQGAAVAAEPLVNVEAGAVGDDVAHDPRPDRPLTGVRVLDLTRVLAGPVATRFLALLGADVLRIDPPGWNEPAVVPEVTAGKRCAMLQLDGSAGRAAFTSLLAGADVLVHGYRPGALAGLGFDVGARARLRPGLVDVSLDAYGWTGPWAGRRGFDSLVQMSSGIAAAGMTAAGGDRPVPLPVQALDHATGYLMAAAALRGLAERRRSGRGSSARLSLARTGAFLAAAPATDDDTEITTDPPLADSVEHTAWGPARRVRLPFVIDGSGSASTARPRRCARRRPPGPTDDVPSATPATGGGHTVVRGASP